MSYYVRIDRVSRTGNTTTETYTNTSRDVAEFMLEDIKKHAPKAPAYVCIDIVRDGVVAVQYDSRRYWKEEDWSHG